jgi:hypothetical protein
MGGLILSMSGPNFMIRYPYWKYNTFCSFQKSICAAVELSTCAIVLFMIPVVIVDKKMVLV